MQVILTRPMKKLGRIGEEVQVKPGYGRYLTLNGSAIRATEHNRQLITTQKNILEEKNKELYLQAVDIAKILEGKELIFVKQAADDGRLYGSVSNKEIAQNLSEIVKTSQNQIPQDQNLAYNFTSTQISLNNALKTIGTFSFSVSIHPEVNIEMNLSVGRTEREAKNFLIPTHTEEDTAKVNEIGTR